MFYFVLSIPTIIYIWLSAIRDVKERMVYTFPALTLSFLWWIYGLWLYKNDLRDFMLSAVICVAIYLFMNHGQIWGAGDSDIFILLFGVLMCSVQSHQCMGIFFLLCIILAAAMSIAITVGLIEGVIRKVHMDVRSGVAVIPGFAMTISLILMYGINWRL